MRVGIVNRGEAAVRFLTTARAMAHEGVEIETVALYTDPDADALFVRQADGAQRIGAGRGAYLDAEGVVAALRESRCDSAWLGWGFSSEDATFAAALEAAGITLLAPRSETMQALGDKIRAKALAESADVPVAPWAIVESAEAAVEASAAIGFPLLIKAASGGGGRGIRLVDSADQIPAAFASARDEAARSFGGGGLMLERFVPRARHIEVQAFGDGEGGVETLGLRDCSLQRRRQKVIEECPAPALPEAVQQRILGAARRLCERVRYRSAGTVEFLYDPADEAAYFLEVNTRLQVEHTVTEMVYGVDLVRAQIELARVGEMPVVGPPRGWAIEARLCAEDPGNDFTPAPGRLARLVFPQGAGVRVDTGFVAGETISAEFDPLIAKLMAWGPTRDAAIGRLAGALAATRVVVAGGATNLGLLRALLAREDFRAADVDTGLVDTLDLAPPAGAGVAAVAAAIDRFLATGDAVEGRDRHRVEAVESLSVFRLGPTSFLVEGAGGRALVEREDVGACETVVRMGGAKYAIERAPGDTRYLVDGEIFSVPKGAGGSVAAPSAALVLDIPVRVGATVAEGDCVAILEAMKMEVRVVAPQAGTVREIRVQTGGQVAGGQVLLVVDGDGERPASAGIRWDEALPDGGAVARLTNGVVGWDCAPALGAHDRRNLAGHDVRPLLAAIADVTSVFERRPTVGGAAVAPWTWLETLQQRGPDALEPDLRDAIARVLERLGVADWKAPGLSEGLRRLARAGRRLSSISAVALDALAALPDGPGRVPVTTLNRLAILDPQRFGEVREAADAARHELYERPAHEQLRALTEARAEAMIERLREGEADWTELSEVPEALVGYLVPEVLGGCPVSAEAIARRLEWHDHSVEVRPIAENAFAVGDRAVAVGSAEALDALATKGVFSGFERVALVTGWPDDVDDVDPTPLRGQPVCVVAVGDAKRARWYDPNGGERAALRDILPSTAHYVDLDRLKGFGLERLPSAPEVALFLATAHTNPSDARLLAFAEVRSLARAPGSPLHLPHVERVFHDALRAIRAARAARDPRRRLQWNQLTLSVRPVVPMGIEMVQEYVRGLAPPTLSLGFEKVVVRARFQDHSAPGGVSPWTDLSVSQAGGRLQFSLRPASSAPLQPLTPHDAKLVAARRRGHLHPYEVIASLERGGELPRGRFREYDLRDDQLVPVHRPRGENDAAVVVGMLETRATASCPATRRVMLLSDPVLRMGALAEAECRRVIGAIELAQAEGLPLEWVAVSAGARIDLTTGTENLDWTARVLGKIVEFTQGGGEINVLVAGLCVGAQAYWNAEATMMMHTRGLLVMTDRGAMVLTGKRALDLSGCVSAEDDLALGGYTTIMGPNGQAQAWAEDLAGAYQLLYRYYATTFAEGPRPARRDTADPADRDITRAPYPASLDHGFKTVGEIFTENPERKRPFSARPIMAGLIDADSAPVERWGAMRDAETAVVWEARIGGYAATVIGVENRPLPRVGRPATDGPDTLAGGTLYPQAARKIARALNAASGRRPVVVVANLSGFDGSPESLAQWQLEYGAEIGRAVVNFDGPILFTIVSRYHGGAYVVFSKALNDGLYSMALEGSYASVIGGAPAAAIVLGREVRRRAHEAGGGPDATAAATAAVAAEFDGVHTVQRALQVGSIDEILAPRRLRARIVERLAADYEAKVDATE